MLFSGTMIALLSTAYFVTDTVVAGIMMGESTVEAVNVVLPIYSMANFIALVFTLGIPILYVNNLGAFRKEEAECRSFESQNALLTAMQQRVGRVSALMKGMMNLGNFSFVSTLYSMKS